MTIDLLLSADQSQRGNDVRSPSFILRIEGIHHCESRIIKNEEGKPWTQLLRRLNPFKELAVLLLP